MAINRGIKKFISINFWQALMDIFFLLFAAFWASKPRHLVLGNRANGKPPLKPLFPSPPHPRNGVADDRFCVDDAVSQFSGALEPPFLG